MAWRADTYLECAGQSLYPRVDRINEFEIRLEYHYLDTTLNIIYFVFNPGSELFGVNTGILK